MIRLQSSWILESATEIIQIDKLFFPFIHRYSTLNWFSRREMPMVVNNPLDSQALLLRIWLDNRCGYFTPKNRRKFNQELKKPLEIDINPFREWQGKFFDRQELDYLFYWHEVAFEIEKVEQREIFWGAVYAIMSYWLSNRKVGRIPAYNPEEIMHYVLTMHEENSKNKKPELELLNKEFAQLDPPESSLTVFPLVFNDEENTETELQSIFHAWYHGHADLLKARREIKNSLYQYSFKLGKQHDFSCYTNLSKNSDIVAFCWSGKELPPIVHEQEIIEPFREEFSELFTRSRCSIKAVDPGTDAYDYLLLFFN